MNMTRIPNYFYSSDPEKQTLHRRIIPTKEQQENQQTRWNDLCEFLTESLNERTNCQISSWIQGSYKFGTQVKPINRADEFDIDLGIYFEWEGDSSSGDFSPKELKTFVQDELINFQNGNDDVKEVIIPPKERCSRIRFNDSFHIDVPSYHLDKNNDKNELATESNIWENSDPKAFYLWFRDNFSKDDCNQIRRIIRYFKIWSRLHLNNSPSSVLLTVLISEIYKNSTEKELDGDDIALKTIAEKIITRLENNKEVLNPVNSEENLNRLNDTELMLFLEELKKLVNIAEEAIDAPSELVSSIAWAKAFLYFFPILDIAIASNEEKALVPMHFVPEVSVVAIPKNNSNHHFTSVNKIGPIPPDCIIKFSLTNSGNLPAGSVVNWMVRNEGAEAEYKNDLGHIAGEKENQLISEEHSEYAGKHFMDIVVTSPVRQIIGFRRIPVEISGTFMPPRNPPKPYYLKFRKKR